MTVYYVEYEALVGGEYKLADSRVVDFETLERLKKECKIKKCIALTGQWMDIHVHEDFRDQ